jgi:hypothetical protein
MLLEAQREGTDIVLPMFRIGAIWGWLADATPPAALPPENSQFVQFVLDVGWAPGPVWSGVENIKSLERTGVRTPNLIKRCIHDSFQGT